MVYAYLTYGVDAWACAKKELIHKVEVGQKGAIRIIGFGHYLEHTTPILLGCIY